MKFRIKPPCERLHQTARLLLPLLATLVIVSGCSTLAGDDLAVTKMSESQIQETGFLPLNADKPGTPVEVKDYLVAGKYTVVVYFSPYDGAYGNLEPGLMQLAQVRQDIAVRTINVNRPGVQGIDMQSPIMINAQGQVLPYFQIYEPSRRLRAQARPAYEQVLQWLRDLPR
ncbi:MAG: hypothetical protein SFV17_00310 [Candidatus Obscuribacter sp.]|nr:hypothetical protein [Candidatus Melainabacteria bacterium]MDX1985105.1 hypothetical protein [Candidatus Obscuribacter sp.]